MLRAPAARVCGISPGVGAAAPAGSRGLRTIKDASRKTFERRHATPWQTIGYRHWKLFLGIGAVILLMIIIKVPSGAAGTLLLESGDVDAWRRRS
jgi:uncharacterized BrkB/YihY/UPF0761 family membrane protein